MRYLAAATALAASLLFFAAPPAAALRHDVILGAGGEVYKLHLGYRSEIFPASSGSDTFLLALEVLHQDGSSDLMVVPDTDIGDDLESTAALIYEERSRTLFLVWDSRVNYIHSVLKLASFDGAQWSDAITVRGGWLTPRGTPQIAVTRDKYEVEIDAEPQVIHRTVLHLAWWEGSDDGEEVLYTPIILENGVYVGNHEVFSMASLEPAGAPGAPALLSEDLARAVSLRSGRDAETVMLGFVDSLTAQVRTVEIRPTPGPLSSVADGLRAQIIELGSLAAPGDDLQILATQIRREVELLSNRAHLNPGVRSYLAQQVYRLVAGTDPASLDPSALADAASNLVVELGNQLLGDRLVNVAGSLRAQIIELGDRTGGQEPPHIFALRVLSSRPAPITPAAPTSLFLSSDGREVLVAWQGEERLGYVESAGDGWSDEASLGLGPDGLDLGAALHILQQRAESR
ncbi:MAG: hypothetical protein KDD47_16515 [Acidobacteria bacterium]|nr:hypothetical protein [Acidobacteriota bacterium]